MASALDYVENLEIDLPDPELWKLALKNGAAKKQGFVDGGSLISFVSGITPAARHDVLNSTLLAQLAASAKYDRVKDTKDWYGFYVHVLGVLGWVMQDFEFEQYSTSGSMVKVSDAVLDVAKGILSSSEIKVLETTIQSLKTKGNEAWWTVFGQKSTNPSGQGNIQVAPCKQDSSGQIVMSIGCFYFSGVATDEHWFWIDYKTSTLNLFKARQISTLDLDVYNQVRKAVIKKLGANAKALIGDLDIK